MTMQLLPHEVDRLSNRWVRAKSVPSRSTSAAGQRAYYIDKLTNEIGAWLAEGLEAWQFGAQRQYAFAPVAWLIGTRREDDSYLDSLADLGKALAHHNDPSYIEPPDDAGDSSDEMDDVPAGVPLGAPFANGAAIAVRDLAHKLTATPAARHELLTALKDALVLVQRLRPGKVRGPLLGSWNLLFGSARQLAALFPEGREALVLQHAYLRALYPAMHAGQDKELFSRLLSDFGSALAGAELAGVLADDYEQCLLRMRFIERLSSGNVIERAARAGTERQREGALLEGASPLWLERLLPRERTSGDGP